MRGDRGGRSPIPLQPGVPTASRSGHKSTSARTVPSGFTGWTPAQQQTARQVGHYSRPQQLLQSAARGAIGGDLVSALQGHPYNRGWAAVEALSPLPIEGAAVKLGRGGYYAVKGARALERERKNIAAVADRLSRDPNPHPAHVEALRQRHANYKERLGAYQQGLGTTRLGIAPHVPADWRLEPGGQFTAPERSYTGAELRKNVTVPYKGYMNRSRSDSPLAETNPGKLFGTFIKNRFRESMKGPQLLPFGVYSQNIVGRGGGPRPAGSAWETKLGMWGRREPVLTSEAPFGGRWQRTGRYTTDYTPATQVPGMYRDRLAPVTNEELARMIRKGDLQQMMGELGSENMAKLRAALGFPTGQGVMTPADRADIGHAAFSANIVPNRPGGGWGKPGYWPTGWFPNMRKYETVRGPASEPEFRNRYGERATEMFRRAPVQLNPGGRRLDYKNMQELELRTGGVMPSSYLFYGPHSANLASWHKDVKGALQTPVSPNVLQLLLRYLQLRKGK